MQGGRLPEINEFCAHAVGLETIEMEYEVLWYAFGHILTVEKAEDRQVSMGMNRELKWQQQNHWLVMLDRAKVLSKAVALSVLDLTDVEATLRALLQ